MADYDCLCGPQRIIALVYPISVEHRLYRGRLAPHRNHLCLSRHRPNIVWSYQPPRLHLDARDLLDYDVLRDLFQLCCRPALQLARSAHQTWWATMINWSGSMNVVL